MYEIVITIEELIQAMMWMAYTIGRLMVQVVLYGIRHLYVGIILSIMAIIYLQPWYSIEGYLITVFVILPLLAIDGLYIKYRHQSNHDDQ